MASFPIVTLQFQNMKHTLMHAIVAHNAEIEAAVSSQIDEHINNFDFEQFVKKEIKGLLEASLRDALKDAVHRALWSQDVKQVLTTDVHTALLKVLREYYPHAEHSDEELRKQEGL